jgi:hypothetical protein
MKVEFLKDDFQFYLGNNMSKMHKSKKGDSIEVNANTAERWIKKEVAKMVSEKVEVKPIVSSEKIKELQEEINSLDKEREDLKPAPKKRGRKKKTV